MKRRVKRYLTDLAGLCLIIAAPLLGWLPGPGGIPLLIAGLALLAINNKWAENLLLYIKNKGEDLAKIIFPANPKYQVLHDILAFCLLGGAIFLLYYTTHFIYLFLGGFLLVLAFIEFIYNRDRIDKIKQSIISIFNNILAFLKKIF